MSGFNTQPPEGGWFGGGGNRAQFFGFNTQPPEGGWATWIWRSMSLFGFNTQPPEGGWASLTSFLLGRLLFQHTAA